MAKQSAETIAKRVASRKRNAKRLAKENVAPIAKARASKYVATPGDVKDAVHLLDKAFTSIRKEFRAGKRKDISDAELFGEMSKRILTGSMV